MKEFIIQAVIIIMWAVVLKEVLLNKFFDWIIEEGASLNLENFVELSTFGSNTRILTAIIYYAIFGACAFDLFGGYSISIAAIITGIHALFMLGNVGWVVFLKSFSGEDRRMIVKMVNKLLVRHRQDCNYGEEGNI